MSFTSTGGRVTARLNFRDFSGVRRRAKAVGRTKSEARRRVMEAVDRALTDGDDSPFKSSSLFEEAISAWLDYFSERVDQGLRSPTSLDLYRHVCERHVVPGVGALRIAEVSAPRVDRFLQSILRRHGYPTAKVTRSVLSGTCSWLVRQGAMSSNPVRDAGRLESTRDRTARSMTEAEVVEWLALLDADPEAVRRDLPDLSRFMLATGLRLGEALGARWSDLDFESSTLRVERTVVRVRGRGLQATRLKSRTSYRVLAVPGWCMTMLRDRLVRGTGDDGPIFSDARGSYRDRSNVGKAFRAAREGTGFDWVRPHTFRKTVATLLDQRGASARAIADQLGHARISMTQDVYMGRQATDRAVIDLLRDPSRPRPEES